MGVQKRLSAQPSMHPSGVHGALKSRPLAAAVSLVLASGAAPPSVAQEAQGAIEEVIVTATRREESIQDIPINIATFSGSVLEEREIGDLAELGRNVPGLYVIDQGKRTSNRVVVRGLSLDPINSAEAIGNNGGNIVSTYVGEIPLYVDLVLNDMERVEVLLGPQGTLYGSGTLGGAIRYIPRRPAFDATTLTFRGTTFDLAHSDDMGVRGGMVGNFPLSDSLAVRFTVDRYDDPGFIDTPFLVREPGVSDPEPDFSDPSAVAANLYSERDANYEETLSGRVGLRWAPVDAVDANFTYYFQDMEVGGRQHNHAAAFGTDRYESATRFPEPNDRENKLLSAEIVADLGFAQLTSATGLANYQELGQRDQTDLLITLGFSYEAFPSFSAFTREQSDDDLFTQEIRLVSQTSGPLSWIGGLFYLSQETDGESREFTPHYDEYLGGVLRPDSLEYINIVLEDLEEKALFGELHYDVTDRWQVAVGARYYDYTYATESGVATPLYYTAIGELPPDETGVELEPTSQTDDGFLYKLNSSYRFADGLMAYFTASEGYRIGAANGIGLCPDPLPDGQNVCASPDEFQYFPDKTTNYEIGIRSQWLDQRLTLNASVYYIDWQDPQLTSATVVGSQPITKNGEGAESRGFEVSIDAQLGDRLSIGLGYARNDAKLTDDAPSLLTELTPPGFGSEFVDGLAGDRLPGSPQDQGTLNVGYEIPVNGDWSLALNYGLAAIGDVITKTGLRAGGEEFDSFTVHTASASLRAGAWTVGLYAQNLTDEYAVTGVRRTPSYVQTVADENSQPVRVRTYYQEMLRPREVGFKFTYDLNL